ncbi:MAG: SDR family NAD(P)-dependent oxidoreductase [Azospirillaceae bacterium]
MSERAQTRESIAGKPVIVTGAARGIGFAIAEALGAVGARLALFDIDRQALDEAVARLGATGVEAVPVAVDLSDAAAIPAAVDNARQALGPIAGLVNNAGIIQLKPMGELSVADFDLTIAINLRAPFLLIQAVAPDLKAAGWGRVVSIASSAGKTGGSSAQGVYGVSKAGVICLTKSWAKELAPSGVTVNSISPALIETDMIKGLSEFVRMVPLGRLGQPAEVAGTVAFLMSDRAAFITGEDIDVNGGFLMD